MWYDGNLVKMVGVGGVASLPEYRHERAVRKCFDFALRDMYENGAVFSARKFGYELALSSYKVNVPMKYFRDYPFTGNFVQYNQGDDITPYMNVYQEYIANKNYAFVRSEKNMKNIIDKDPYLTCSYSYLHYDNTGKPDAYLVFSRGSGQDSYDFRVRELIWTKPEGLQAMFGFIGGLSAQVYHFKWNAPDGINLLAMFSECTGIEIQHAPRGMNRVVNAARALELMKAPLYKGSAVISVNDEFMPCNTGVYALEWDNGRILSVTKTDKAADMEIDAQTLAPLIMGYMDFNEIRLMRSVRVNQNADRLRDLFPRKELFVTESF
jgi:predicted acetyltransferase